jgi:hypothetical protein
MNAHFSMMGSAAQSVGHSFAAKIFAALTLAALVSTLLCGVVLWRTRPMQRT